MKKLLAPAIFLLASLLLVPAFAEAPEGFTPLFNGKDMTGWKPCKRDYRPIMPADAAQKGLVQMSDEERAKFYAENQAAFDAHWYVENGELVNDGNGPYASTEKFYRDFELLLEYKTVPLADSGIYLRGNPQVQIWDTRKEGGKWAIGADKGSGGLWNNKNHERHPLVYADKPFGEWNSVRVTIKGNVVNVWLNGKQTVKDTVMEYTWNKSIDMPEIGPIQLQTHGGEIRWRNIYIKEL